MATHPPLPLLRHRRLPLHHLLPPHRRQDRLRRRQRLHAQALPPARLRARPHRRRHRLLPPLPRSLPQAARDAAGLQHPHQIRLPLRLRPLPRPRAALLPLAHRNLRRLQSHLPRLLRRLRPPPHQLPPARPDRSHARRRRPQRARARHRPDLRRRAHPPPRLLRHPRRRQAPPHQAPHGQHQRHPHRHRRRLRRAPRHLHAASSSSISSSTHSNAIRSCISAAPTSAPSAPRPSKNSTRSTSPPHSSSPSSAASTTTSSARIIDFALQQPCVRGVTFQPVQQAGRLTNFDSAEHRLTLTEVRRRILEQTRVFTPEDLIPVPCHPDSLAMAYALKLAGKVVPLTGMIPPDVLINGGRNTIIYEQAKQGIHEAIFKLFSTNHSPQSQATTLRDLLCCLPQVSAPEPQLRQPLPHPHRAVHRRPDLRPPLHQEDLRPHRPPRRPTPHPLRHLQHLLSRQPRADPPRPAPRSANCELATPPTHNSKLSETETLSRRAREKGGHFGRPSQRINFPASLTSAQIAAAARPLLSAGPIPAGSATKVPESAPAARSRPDQSQTR